MANNAASTTVTDSTSHAANGTAQADTNTKTTTGEVDGALAFNGTSDYIGVPQNGDFTLHSGPFTLEAWVQDDTTSSILNPGAHRVLSWYDGTNSMQLGLAGNLTPAQRVFFLLNSSASAIPNVITIGNAPTGLNHVVGTFDGSTYHIYLNGVNADGGSNNSQVAFTGNSTTLYLGQRGDNIRYLAGTLDEVRISSINRSAAWIATEYNNQSSPSTFETLGALQDFVAAPTLSPAAGAYFNAQTVTISTITQGASIRYTTNGSTPTETNGTLYSGAFSMSASATVNAIAYVSGSAVSPVSSATYIIATAPPTFSPVGGNYSSAQSVSLSSATSGASIRYTTDGSTPSETAGTLYSGPIAVTSNITINAIAYESGLADSSITSAACRINWYNSAWANRNSVTINYPQVSGASNLTNFPMLFSVTNASFMTVANGGNVGKSDGSDILFTASDGLTKLNHELEYYNPSTGQVIAWVQIPSLSPTANTVIYVYDGNPSAANQQNPTAVWDSNYKGVWHFSNGTTLSASDSTSNGNNGTISGATAASGFIDGAADFNGASYISESATTNTSVSSLTVSVWMQAAQAPQNSYATLFDSRATGYQNWILDTGVQGNKYQFCLETSTEIQDCLGSGTLDTNWHYLVGSYNGSTQALYLDGAPIAQSSVSIQLGTGSYPLNWGSSNDSASFFNGLLDEARLSNIARSSAWIATEYNNQSSPSTFFTLGGP
jgi:hypothetical protein